MFKQVVLFLLALMVLSSSAAFSRLNSTEANKWEEGSVIAKRGGRGSSGRSDFGRPAAGGGGGGSSNSQPVGRNPIQRTPTLSRSNQSVTKSPNYYPSSTYYPSQGNYHSHY